MKCRSQRSSISTSQWSNSVSWANGGFTCWSLGCHWRATVHSGYTPIALSASLMSRMGTIVPIAGASLTTAPSRGCSDAQ